MIQTVDTLKLANKINKIAKNLNVTKKIMIQVNTGKDPLKHGFSTIEAIENCQKLLELKNITIIGIMMIAPLLKDKKELRKIFKKTKATQTKIQKKIKTCKYLSMGMTTDYAMAIEEGSTHVRIGTALFGKRGKK